jgi:hydroxypyruvate reductase
LKCGATINEINTLRKHLDGIKGGGLARFAYPAKVLTLILSDVMGDPLDVIASGPTVPDSTTFGEAYGVLTKYGIVDQVPKEIVNGLLEGIHAQIPETPKEGDPIFRDAHSVVIGNNQSALRAGLETAKDCGFQPIELSTHLKGEARRAGNILGALGRQYHRFAPSSKLLACLAVGGETTVTIKGNGLGGRNQEVALGAIQELAGLQDIILVALATDGGDGPTDAAGAVVTGDTLERAKRLDLDPEDFLNRNDAYHFFEPLGDLLKPGPTNTNVNDLTFIFSLTP